MASLQLDGLVTLVTGGSTGIGAEICRHLAAEGAKLHICDISDTDGTALARDLGATYHRLDVTNELSWRSVVNEISNVDGKIDILVNNAGIALAFVPLHERTADEWLRIMAVNATGAFLGMASVIPIMLEQGSGSIINISSAAALGQWQSMDSAYAASKAAVRVLTKTAGTQYASRGIRCNSIHPGPIESEMARRVLGTDPSLMAKRLERVPMKRLGLPSEIAAAVVYLASAKSSYMTGAELAIDGGATAQ